MLQIIVKRSTERDPDSEHDTDPTEVCPGSDPVKVPEPFLQHLQSVPQKAQPLLADWCEHSRSIPVLRLMIQPNL